MLAYSVPPGYRRQSSPRRPKLDPFTGVIDQILDDDHRVPKKQRHTAKRIFERLRDEYGFDGGYTIVKDYVREHRRRTREMFVPLSHPPGHAQCRLRRSPGDHRRGATQGPTVSSSTCPTATDASSRPIPPRPPRLSWTGTCRRSHFWAGFPGASSTTIPSWPWPRSWETVNDSAHAPSRSYSPTTCSMTGSGVLARATTRARWRAWLATRGGTSWCLSRPSRALRS